MSNDFGQKQFQRQQFGHDVREFEKAVDIPSIRKNLQTPARGLLITGLLSVLMSIGGLAGGVIYSAMNRDSFQRYWVIQLFGEEITIGRDQRNTKRIKELKEQREGQAQTAFALVLGAISIGCLTLSSVYMLYVSAGIMMGQLNNYKVCRLVCLLAMVPIISPLVVAGIPFGLMGYRQLRKPEVQKAFNY